MSFVGPFLPPNWPLSREGLMLMSRAPSSFATASAIIVLPAPEGPYKSTALTFCFSGT